MVSVVMFEQTKHCHAERDPRLSSFLPDFPSIRHPTDHHRGPPLLLAHLAIIVRLIYAFQRIQVHDSNTLIPLEVTISLAV